MPKKSCRDCGFYNKLIRICRQIIAWQQTERVQQRSLAVIAPNAASFHIHLQAYTVAWLNVYNMLLLI